MPLHALATHPSVRAHLDAHPAPLLFATISGAHLYGFDSPDSDIDLRGCHCTPLPALLALDPPSETIEVMDKSGPLEVDLVTHDVRKFLLLLLKNNGYVLEQIMSPLVVYSTPEFDELRTLAPRCITRYHSYHFRSFADNQWKLVSKSDKPTAKQLLYAFRVVLAGIHLMRTGIIESNLVKLNEVFNLPYIPDLIHLKIHGTEKQSLNAADLSSHESEFNRLCAELDEARLTTSLPEQVDISTRHALNDLLIRLRLTPPIATRRTNSQ